MQELPEAEQEILLGQCLRVVLVDAEAGTLLCEHLPGVLGHLVAKDVEVGARGLRYCDTIGTAVWPISP
jgi:hypothetical protein